MPPTRPAYGKDEFARRGDRMYEREVEPRVKPEDTGKVAAIDIESGDFALDVDEARASARLRARKPDAQIWLRRVGSRYVRHFGPRSGLAAR